MADSRDEALLCLRGMASESMAPKLLEEMRAIARSNDDATTEAEPAQTYCVGVIRWVETFPDDEEIATLAPSALTRFGTGEDVWLAARCMWRFPDSAAVQLSAIRCFIAMLQDKKTTPSQLQDENVVQLLTQALLRHTSDEQLQFLGRSLISMAVERL